MYAWVLLLGISLFIAGCSSQPVLIERITVMKEPADGHAPTGHFAPLPDKPVPQVAVVGTPYHPGDALFLILAMSDDLEEPVTFSRFTFYNVKTKEETDLPLPEDLVPFTAGQIFTVAFGTYWSVPDEPGTYEIRVYAGDREEISAPFTVE